MNYCETFRIIIPDYTKSHIRIQYNIRSHRWANLTMHIMQAAGCKADIVAFLNIPFTCCRRPSSASCPLARELVDVFQEREWVL